MVTFYSNGGGYIGLSYATLRALILPYSGASVYNPYDMREGALNDQLVNIGFYDKSQWLIIGTENVYTDDSWYNPISRTRGGLTSNYTQLIGFNQLAPDFEMDNGNYYFDKIVVLTDGTCGSACNYFASKLKEDKRAWLVSAGGVIGQPMDIASFAGGNVEDWEPFVDYINQYTSQTQTSLNNRPVNLPSSAGLFIFHF
jgi:hypothetical protein